jgi:hypothetical protein
MGTSVSPCLSLLPLLPLRLLVGGSAGRDGTGAAVDGGTRDGGQASWSKHGHGFSGARIYGALMSAAMTLGDGSVLRSAYLHATSSSLLALKRGCRFSVCQISQRRRAHLPVARV